MSVFSKLFVENGFKKINENNVYQQSDSFIKSVNLQRKSSGDKYFINLGVSPVIDGVELLSKMEIDAYIRFRIYPQDGFSIDSIDDPIFLKKLYDGPIDDFFSAFMSIDEIFSKLTLQKIMLGELPKYLKNNIGITRVSYLCAKYWISKNEFEKAKELANYGLTTVKLGGKYKKLFKEILAL